MTRHIVSSSVVLLFLATFSGADALAEEKKSEGGKAIAQPGATSAQPAVGTCHEGWQAIPARVPGSKVALSLATTKDGQPRLQWSAHKAELVTQLIRKAKGPVNAKGDVEMCGAVLRISTFTDSNTLSLRDLKDANKLPSGYYAMRVIIGGNEYAEGDKSDWVTIQLH